MTRSRTPRRLSLQNLESRNLMAGNVVVNFSSQDLTITGDSQSNELRIYESTTVANRLVIEGLNGTTINGQTHYVLQVSQLDDVKIDLNDGHDRLLMTNISLTNTTSHSDLTIEGDGGNDYIYMDNVSGFTGEIEIDTHGGNDTVWMRGVYANDIDVETGDHDDVVTMINILAHDAYVRTGSGQDRVTMNNVDVQDDLYADLGGGNDYLQVQSSSGNDVTFLGGTGIDTLKRAPATGYYANTFNDVNESSNFETFQ